MPSVRTARPRRRSDRAVAGLWLMLTAVALVVAGCSSGTATDSRRAQEQDAQRTSIVDGLQATESSRLLEPGTPRPDGTPTPPPG